MLCIDFLSGFEAPLEKGVINCSSERVPITASKSFQHGSGYASTASIEQIADYQSLRRQVLPAGNVP
jgi:hypothetical protein